MKPEKENETMEITGTAKMEITPEKLADAFVGLDEDGMVTFFGRVGAVMAGWDTGGRCMQMLGVGRKLLAITESSDKTRQALADLADALTHDEPRR